MGWPARMVTWEVTRAGLRLAGEEERRPIWKWQSARAASFARGPGLLSWMEAKGDGTEARLAVEACPVPPIMVETANITTPPSKTRPSGQPR